MKKSIIIMSLLLTTSAIANSFDGPYLGLSAGATMRNVDYKMTLLSAEVKRIISPYSKDYTKTGFVGGIYGGYGKTFDNIYIGGEGSVHYDSANGWENHSVNANFPHTSGIIIPGKMNFKTQYKKDIVFGLTARIGHIINKELMVYIKPGLEISRDRFIRKNISVVTPDATFPLSDSDSASEWKIKLAPGIGFEYLILKNMIARLEYTCSVGINNKVKEKTESNDDIGGEISHVSHALRVGVAYKF